MPAGRPSKYKPEFCDLVVQQMSQGYSAEACAGDMDISKETLYRWIREIPEFCDAVGRGMSLGRKFWEKIGIAGTLGQIQRFNSSTYMFLMRNRFGYNENPADTQRAQITETQENVEELLERLENFEKKLEAGSKDVTPKITEKKLKLLSGAQ
jgi:hypothetical protein